MLDFLFLSVLHLLGFLSLYEHVCVCVGVHVCGYLHACVFVSLVSHHCIVSMMMMTIDHDHDNNNNEDLYRAFHPYSVDYAI